MHASTMTLSLGLLMEGSYDAAYKQVCKVLKAAGFEITAEIDLASLLAPKRGLFLRPYKIILVCNPDLTQRALTISPDIGVVLPTTVVVSQLPDDQVEVKLPDPLVTWVMPSESYLKPIAEELRQQLNRVLDALRR